MIQNEQEYQFSKSDSDHREARIKQYRRQFAEQGLTPDEVERALAPIVSFNLGIQEEVTDYESNNHRDL